MDLKLETVRDSQSVGHKLDELLEKETDLLLGLIVLAPSSGLRLDLSLVA